MVAVSVADVATVSVASTTVPFTAVAVSVALLRILSTVSITVAMPFLNPPAAATTELPSTSPRIEIPALVSLTRTPSTMVKESGLPTSVKLTSRAPTITTLPSSAVSVPLTVMRSPMSTIFPVAEFSVAPSCTKTRRNWSVCRFPLVRSNVALTPGGGSASSANRSASEPSKDSVLTSRLAPLKPPVAPKVMPSGLISQISMFDSERINP